MNGMEGAGEGGRRFSNGKRVREKREGSGEWGRKAKEKQRLLGRAWFSKL